MEEKQSFFLQRGMTSSLILPEILQIGCDACGFILSDGITAGTICFHFLEIVLDWMSFSKHPLTRPDVIIYRETCQITTATFAQKTKVMKEMTE